MTKLTLLTDGCFEQCATCIGRVVHGTPFLSQKKQLVGFDVPVKELNRVGATFNMVEWEDDATLYFSVEHNEIEEMQDEYR